MSNFTKKFSDSDNTKDDEKSTFSSEEAIYSSAVLQMCGGKIEDYKSAIELLKQIPDWKDSKELIDTCNSCINGLIHAQQRKDAENKRKTASGKRKKKLKSIFVSTIIITIVASLAVAGLHFYKAVDNRYNEACDLLNEGYYDKAISSFETIKWYKNSKEQIKNSQYKQAEAFYNQGEKAKAAILFGKLAGYQDALEKSKKLWRQFNTEAINIDTTVFNTFMVKNDGTVMYTGKDYQSNHSQVKRWTDIIAVSAGSYHAVGLQSNGTVLVTECGAGWLDFGQFDVSNWTDIVAISAGEKHTVGLKSDGTVVAAGSNNEGQCNVSDWEDMIAISASDCYTLGLKSDGSIVATGRIAYSDPMDLLSYNYSEWNNIVSISAGPGYFVGIKVDGTVIATVSDLYSGFGGKIPSVYDWNDIVSVYSGAWCVFGVKIDGTVVVTGGNPYSDYGERNVSDWTDIIAISASNEHTVGIKSNGEVVATGKNDYGQCDVSDWCVFSYNNDK